MEHPDETLTASYLDGDLTGEARDRFESHLSRCGSCRAGVALLRTLPAGPGRKVAEALMDKARKIPPGRKRFGLPSMLGTAASLLLVAVAAYWALGPSGPLRPVPTPLRGEHSSGFTDLSPAPGASVPSELIVFRWSLLEGADRYALSVFDSGGEKLLEISAGEDDRSASWPADHPRLPPGAYLWKIRALALDRTVAESDTIPFEVSP